MSRRPDGPAAISSAQPEAQTPVTGAVAGDNVLAVGGTVVTATHRLARQIRHRHDRLQAASGALAWPTADVLPLDAWLRRTWEFNLLRNTPLGERRLLSDDESRLIWRRILGQEGSGRIDSGVLVPLVAGGWRLCQAWGIRETDLVAAADSEDTRIFGQWVARYVGELRNRRWLDQASLLAALGTADAETCIGRERVIGFAGFEPWTPAMDDLNRGLKSRGVRTTRIVPPERHGSLRVVAARNASDELARAVDWAAGHATDAMGLPVGIVLPDLERDADLARRIGMDVLSPGWQLREPHVRPVALAAGRQLADYPVIVAALNVLRMLVTGISFEQASLFLRSVYVAGAAVERGERARAELRLRRMPLEEIPRARLSETLEREAAVLAAGQWHRAVELADTVRSRRLLPGQWAGHFSAWLAAAGWPGDRGLASEEFQAAEAWQGALESFAGTDEVAGSLTLRAALGILAQWVRDRPFEPEAPGEAIQVLSVREAEGQDFAALWICGMTADQWPPPARPHPLIPLTLQQSAGIPEATAAALAAQTAERFGRLRASADQLVLSWPVERDEAETLPSPLLAAWPCEAASTDDFPRTPYRQRVAAAGEAEVVIDDPPRRLEPGRRITGGSRVLAMQAVCPARAFVEFRLGGAPLEPPARPLDAGSRGRIVHSLLDAIYSSPPFAGGLGAVGPLALRDAFDTAIDGVLDTCLPPGNRFRAGLRRLEVERLWALLLTVQALDAARPPFTVETEVAREVAIGPLSLRVRLDRLDRVGGEGHLVIDYKTGQVDVGGWKRARLPESQLPLYAVTSRCRGVAVIQIRPPGALLKGVGDEALGVAGVRAPADFFKEPGLDWNGTLDRWQGQLEALATEFAAGDFRVNPEDRRWAVGQFAPLTRIHGFGPVSGSDEPGEGADE